MATPPAKEIFAANVNRELEVRGWTKTKLATLCGWKPPRITEVLGGKICPTLDTADIVAAALGVPVANLLIPAPELITEKISV